MRSDYTYTIQMFCLHTCCEKDVRAVLRAAADTASKQTGEHQTCIEFWLFNKACDEHTQVGLAWPSSRRCRIRSQLAPDVIVAYLTNLHVGYVAALNGKADVGTGGQPKVIELAVASTTKDPEIAKQLIDFDNLLGDVMRAGKDFVHVARPGEQEDFLYLTRSFIGVVVPSSSLRK